MRIGIDCRMYSINFTGIGRYVYELIDHLANIDQGEHEYFLFFNPVEYQKFITKTPNFHKVYVNAPHYTLQEQWNFYKILQKKKLDLMHFTHFNAPILYNRPFLTTIHDLTLSFYPGKKMTKWYYRFAYHLTIKHAVKKAKYIIAVSQNTQKDLLKLFNIPKEKTTVIYEGVNREFFRETSPKEKKLILEKYGIRTPFLLYTGVWRDHKNLVNLIKAFHILKKDKKLRGQLVITGKENPYYPEVKKNVEKFKLERFVLFPGLVPEDDLVALYQTAKMYVFPSFYEGFGLSLLEAMSCKLPVVTSNSSCIPEICGENNAIFFNPHDPKDIAEKIYLVYSDTALRENLKIKGLKRVGNFSWEKMAKRTHELYNNITLAR